jgi:hypothetical protein
MDWNGCTFERLVVHSDVNIADLAVIDDRNRHTLGVGAVHDLAHFGVDGGAVGYCLRERRDGKVEGGKKHSQKRKNRLSRSHGDQSVQNWKVYPLGLD